MRLCVKRDSALWRDLSLHTCPDAGEVRIARRCAGVPHRPLPGQGDRAELDRAALLQLVHVALLEQELHRQRADHIPGDRLLQLSFPSSSDIPDLNADVPGKPGGVIRFFKREMVCFSLIRIWRML